MSKEGVREVFERRKKRVLTYQREWRYFRVVIKKENKINKWGYFKCKEKVLLFGKLVSNIFFLRMIKIFFFFFR